MLGFTGKLIVVGFGMAKTEYAIGRLMAFDAEIIGTWGCLPEYYPIVLDMVLCKKIDIDAFRGNQAHEHDCGDLCRGPQGRVSGETDRPDAGFLKWERPVETQMNWLINDKRRKRRFIMALNGCREKTEEKNHDRYGSEHWGTQAPCTVYEKRPLKDPKGKCRPRALCGLDYPE